MLGFNIITVMQLQLRHASTIRIVTSNPVTLSFKAPLLGSVTVTVYNIEEYSKVTEIYHFAL